MNLKWILILIGLWNIIDGVLSILVQLDESFLFQFGRIVRTILGIALIIIGVKFNSKKDDGYFYF